MYDKTLIYSIIYTIFIILIDKTKVTKKYKFEPLKLFNYLIWFILSTYSYIIPDNRWNIIKFCSNTIVTNFIYETIYYPEDFMHNLHHIMTIITIIYSYFTTAKNKYILESINIYYVAFFSSIFSSIRKLCKIKYNLNDIKTIIVYHLYKLSYVFSKGWGIYFHYKLLFTNFSLFNFHDKISAFMCMLIHFIQAFFIYKIIK